MQNKILFFAPFFDMAEMASEVAQAKGSNDFIIKVGRNEEALNIALEYPEVTVIISRGGTAEDLSQLKGRSIVKIKITFKEIFMSLQKIMNETDAKKIGIVSRSSLLDDSQMDFSVLKSQIYFRPCKNDEEIVKEVNILAHSGIEAIVGCELACRTASQNQIPSELLCSSETSIRKAMTEALTIFYARQDEGFRNAQLMAIIDNTEDGIVVISEKREVTLSNKAARDLLGNIDEALIQKLLDIKEKNKISTMYGRKIIIRVTPLLVRNINKGNLIVIREASNIQDIERQVRIASYHKGLYAKKAFKDLVTIDENMQALIKKAEKYARSTSTILLNGETGVGKDLLAQGIHQASSRKDGPFVSVNCGAIPQSLMESELFGYVEGAFTGARRGGKKGFFEMANGGTVFLDEIEEMPASIQVRLLRVLQEREIMRVGDDKVIPVDIRIVCATNQDIYQLALEKKFRLDLYYRIKVLKLNVPPLRQRSKDIMYLLRYQITRFLKDTNRTIDFTPAAVKILQNYSWKGNIRELINLAEVLACGDHDDIDAAEINELLESPLEEGEYIHVPKTASLQQMELAVYNELLKTMNITQVCAQLGISRATLWRKFHNKT